MGSRRSNGEGTFVKLPDGRFRMRRQYGYTRNGGTRILTVTGKTKSECIKRMYEKIEKMPAFIYTTIDAGTTVEELCRKHLEYALGQEHMIKPTAADRRECTIRNQIEPSDIGHMQVGAVKPRDINDFINGLINTGRYSVSTIDKAFDVINSAYEWAIRREMLAHNPCTAVKDTIKARLSRLSAKNDIEQDVVILSEEEERTIRKTAFEKTENGTYKYPLGLCVLFLLETGIRIGEFCALKWGDVHVQKEGSVMMIKRTRFYARARKDDDTWYSVQEGISKNAHARALLLSDTAVKVLEEYRKKNPNATEDDYIHLNRSRKPTNPSNLDNLINNYYRAIGLTGVSGAHILRRSFATKMFRSGAAIKEIAAYIGDLESTTAKHYIAVRRMIKAGDDIISVVPLPALRNKNE